MRIMADIYQYADSYVFRNDRVLRRRNANPHPFLLDDEMTVVLGKKREGAPSELGELILSRRHYGFSAAWITWQALEFWELDLLEDKKRLVPAFFRIDLMEDGRTALGQCAAGAPPSCTLGEQLRRHQNGSFLDYEALREQERALKDASGSGRGMSYFSYEREAEVPVRFGRSDEERRLLQEEMEPDRLISFATENGLSFGLVDLLFFHRMDFVFSVISRFRLEEREDGYWMTDIILSDGSSQTDIYMAAMTEKDYRYFRSRTACGVILQAEGQPSLLIERAEAESKEIGSMTKRLLEQYLEEAGIRTLRDLGRAMNLAAKLRRSEEPASSGEFWRGEIPYIF